MILSNNDLKQVKNICEKTLSDTKEYTLVDFLSIDLLLTNKIKKSVKYSLSDLLK